ncbi:unnamed protein product [Paramecium sonneborni]|nr:unnamed protein product [Paramecium sonneborni]
MKLQEDGSSVDIISSLVDDSSQQGSEQFDITISECADSTDQQYTEYKTSSSLGVYTIQQCHTNIERILKSFSNHNLDTLPGIRESIVKLILTD